MKNEISVVYDENNDLIHVISNGAKNINTARDLWEQVSALAEKTNCFKVLGVAYTEKNHSTLDGYNHAKLFQEIGIDYRYRIAWVETNPDVFDDVTFITTVLGNRGTQVQLFSDSHEAKKWIKQ